MGISERPLSASRHPRIGQPHPRLLLGAISLDLFAGLWGWFFPELRKARNFGSASLPL